MEFPINLDSTILSLRILSLRIDCTASGKKESQALAMNIAGSRAVAGMQTLRALESEQHR